MALYYFMGELMRMTSLANLPLNPTLISSCVPSSQCYRDLILCTFFSMLSRFNFVYLLLNAIAIHLMYLLLNAIEIHLMYLLLNAIAISSCVPSTFYYYYYYYYY